MLKNMVLRTILCPNKKKEDTEECHIMSILTICSLDHVLSMWLN